ncbi:unnamed protein product [Ceutorhynchus assimilis]|uniref:MADF domain-containing protein n=1 Tax=Ceutorhynchus assimilis TaxID=467358 RepID=A0A9N9MZA7_9CUCU|nr:unnamed protein product [Ceutorhynchus assimilis]
MLVESKECLWKISDKDYSNRDKKTNAWQEICKEMFPDWEELDQDEKREKGISMGCKIFHNAVHVSLTLFATVLLPMTNSCCRAAKCVSVAKYLEQNRIFLTYMNLQGQKSKKKWKNLKDRFQKEVRMEKAVRSGSAASKKKKYVYYDIMQFLLRQLESRSTESNIEPPNPPE